MKSIKISVIIPIYNVEKYLRRCLETVINQTYKNLEIILVDDGSRDGCPAICDEYAKKDSRVRVIHKKNGGQSSARNAALDSPIEGDYITFVDSDDWLALDAYEYCVNIINQLGADIVQFARTLATDVDVLTKNPKIEKRSVFEGKDILQHYMTTTTTTGSYAVWRCLFLRQLTDGIRFREGKINEDIDWKYRVIERSKRWVDSNQIKYYYYQSGNSTSGAPLRKRDFQLREAADLLSELTSKETYGTIAFLGRVKQARTAFSLLCKIAYFGIGDTDIDKKSTVYDLTKEHRKNLGLLLKAPLPISRKILAIMFAMNYRMSECFIHMAKKLKA